MTNSTTDTGALRAEDVPSALRSHVEALTKAARTRVPMVWNEADAFIDAEGPRSVGRILVGALHSHLDRRDIGYLFRERIKSRDRVVLAKASKVGGKLEHFSNLDFLVEVNWESWHMLDVRQRVALIDHELSHFGIDTEKDTDVLLSHDLEEFTSIVRRWGAWRPDITRFVKAAAEHAQLDAFASEPPVRVSDEGAEEIRAARERETAGV